MKMRRQKLFDDRLLTTRPNTRSKTLANREQNAFPIPDDLAMEIFSRLPVKSIAVCHCVSKHCASILRSQYFTNSFLAKSSTRPRILFACENNGELFFFSVPQIQNPDENSSPLVDDYLTKFTVDSGSYEIGGHVNGLVSLMNKQVRKGKTVTVPMICNFSTGQSVFLPKMKTRRVDARCLLGYDSIGKQLKVLSMTRDRRNEQEVWGEYQVMTLGTRNLSWRMIDCCVPRYGYPHRERCINGVLYYTSERTRGTFTLLCFDFRSEKFSSVSVKEPLENPSGMINYKGKLGILRFVGGRYAGIATSIIKLLVLEDIEKGEWSEQIYALPPVWKNMVMSTACEPFVGVIGNEIVMTGYGPWGRIYLFYFNTERNSIVRVEIQGMGMAQYHETRIFLDYVEDVKRL